MAANDSTDIRARVLRGIDKGTPDAQRADGEPSIETNSILAFIDATESQGGCYCGNRSYDHGAVLVAMMAAKLCNEDRIDMKLSARDCADVLNWLVARSTREGVQEIRFGGRLPQDKESLDADPGFGWYLVLQHVEGSLRQSDLCRERPETGRRAGS